MSAKGASTGGGTTRRLPALERFARACLFDPVTGCVRWNGGTTSGRGGTVRYGSFWFEGRRHLAHRWAAEHIHGLNPEEGQIRHTCREPLCVQHLELIEGAQTGTTRQYYMGVERGWWEREPGDAPPDPDPEAIPFFWPPDWLAPFLTRTETNSDPF